ncbi:MAG: hypothetical protein EXS00_06370 [Phycisphaerales bacterium]|nr:hypothetical protein [Phycisphaerales bacterium]
MPSSSFAVITLTVAAVLQATPPDARTSTLEAALALVPASAEAFIVIADLTRVSADVEECMAAINRPESLLAGKPIDQLKAWLGVSTAFNEKGAMVMYAAPVGEALAYALLIPVDDAKLFISGNLMPAAGGPDGAFMFREEPVFAREVGSHVLISSAQSLLTEYVPAADFAASTAQRLGARGWQLAVEADLAIWASSRAIAVAQARVTQLSAGAAILSQASDVLIAVDVDALGLTVRSYSVFTPGTALAELARGAPGITGGASLRRLPAGKPYFAMCADSSAVGGGEQLLSWLRKLDTTEALIPSWMSTNAALVKSLSLAAYPSKLGLIAGGFMNDSAIVIETEDASAVLGLMKGEIMAATGSSNGVRREASWEDSRVLKDGTSASAFEVKETPLGPSEAPDAALGSIASRQMVKQVLLGPRGLHGFAVAQADALVVTLSQRQDVLARAQSASRVDAAPDANAEASLASDAVVRSMSALLPPDSALVGFVWLGQIAKAAKQLTALFGAGGAMPEIPTRMEPIAFGLAVGGGCFEAALVLPTPVLSVIAAQSASMPAEPTP